MNWKPRQPKRLASFKGGYNHISMISNKNIILQNYANHPTFIVRKMEKKTFKAECNPLIDIFFVFFYCYISDCCYNFNVITLKKY